MRKQKQKLPQIKENDVKRALNKFFKRMNIWHFHILQGLGCYKGIPDKFAVYDGKVYAVEVKKPGGKQSRYQVAFQEKWEHFYGKTYILARSVDDVIDGMGLRDRFLL